MKLVMALRSCYSDHVMKHSKNTLQIFTVIVAVLALVIAIANSIYLVMLDPYVAKNSISSYEEKARINQLIECANGNKNVCKVLQTIK